MVQAAALRRAALGRSGDTVTNNPVAPNPAPNNDYTAVQGRIPKTGCRRFRGAMADPTSNQHDDAAHGDGEWAQRSAQRGAPFHVMPWLVLVVGVTLTLAVWKLTAVATQERIEDRFSYRVDEVQAALESHLSAYELVLLGGAGLFSVADQVTESEWRTYVESLNIQANYPGILGVGVSWRVPVDQRDQFEARFRARGTPDFKIWPEGPRDEYTSIIYLEPLNWRNQRAIGYDMYSEPVRRAAMEQARDTGKTAVSGKIKLVQETKQDVQPGFLMYVPLYARGEPTDTVEARRAALRGYVYSPFRAKDLVRGVFQHRLGNVGLEIFDGTQPSADALMYRSASLDDLQEPTPMQTLRRLNLRGHAWTLRLTALPGMYNPGVYALPSIVLISGLTISALLFLVMWALVRTRGRALSLASRMTVALRERNERLREITSTLGEGVVVQDAQGLVTFANPAAVQHLGWTQEELVGRHARATILSNKPDDSDLVQALRDGRAFTSEQRYLTRRDGSMLPVSLSARPITRDGHYAGNVIAFHDVSEEQRIQEALRRSQQFRALFEYSLEGLFLIDVSGHVVDVNRVACEMLGYERDRLLGRYAGEFMHLAQTGLLNYEKLSEQRGEPQSQAAVNEVECTRADGSTFSAEVTFSPVEHQDGRLFLVTARDVSARKGAEEVIAKMLSELAVARRQAERANQELKATNEKLLQLSQQDPLTGIANRRHFSDFLRHEWQRALRGNSDLSLVLLDIDHFKAYNDHYGHQAGDLCLRRVAAVLEGELNRPGDMLARYGGEEFVIVLPNTPIEGAAHIAETLRQAIERVAIPHERSPVDSKVTLSMGVAGMSVSADVSPDMLLRAADRALYKAKRSGRNRVMVSLQFQGVGGMQRYRDWTHSIAADGG